MEQVFYILKYKKHDCLFDLLNILLNNVVGSLALVQGLLKPTPA